MSIESRIEAVMAEYRNELLSGMHRYHGCDVYGNARACKADVYRVDHVILPVVRKMLEDALEPPESGLIPVSYSCVLCGRSFVITSTPAGFSTGSMHACTGGKVIRT